MQNWKIKLSLFLNYFVFAILLNSVGPVILLVTRTIPGMTKEHAAVLEPFKDLSIAILSFIVTSFITRIGYKKAMLIALGFVSVVCFIMPFSSNFVMVELLFASAGSSFALIKMSVYGSIGLVTKNQKEHISLMNFIESFFGVGVVSSCILFSFFVDENRGDSSGWRNVYFLLGGISVLAFFLLLTSTLNETAAKDLKQGTNPADFRSMFKLLAIPVVLAFIVCAFFYVLLEQSIMSWLPTFNSEVLQLSDVLAIRMAAILAGSMALGRFLAGVVLKKLNWLVVLIACVALAACIVIFTLPAIAKFIASYKGGKISNINDVPAIAYVFPLIGLVIAPIYPAINSVILSSLAKPKHGLMSGLIIIFSALGGSTGSLITANIFQHFGGEDAMYFSLVPITLLIIFLIIFKRLQRPRVENIDTKEVESIGEGIA